MKDAINLSNKLMIQNGKISCLELEQLTLPLSEVSLWVLILRRYITTMVCGYLIIIVLYSSREERVASIVSQKERRLSLGVYKDT